MDNIKPMISVLNEDYVYKHDSRSIFKNKDVVLKLTGVKADVFECFLDHEKNEIIPKRDFILKAWGKTDEVNFSSSLSQQIYLLRRELDKIGLSSSIRSVSKKGYQLDMSRLEKMREPTKSNNYLLTLLFAVLLNMCTFLILT